MLRKCQKQSHKKFCAAVSLCSSQAARGTNVRVYVPYRGAI